MERSSYEAFPKAILVGLVLGEQQRFSCWVVLSGPIQNMQRACRLVPNLPLDSWDLWIHRETIIR